MAYNDARKEMKTFKTNTGILTAILCMMVLLLWSTLGVAKGRGGDPGVCDGESGRAFGLCNAYCEAMDCDWDPNASAARSVAAEAPRLRAELYRYLSGPSLPWPARAL